jgi:hypothetical protein
LQSLQKHCNGDYVNVDPENVLCSKDINSFNKVCIYKSLLSNFMSRISSQTNNHKVNTGLLFLQAISGINKNHILEPLCEWLYNEISPKRSLIQKYNSRVPPLSCRVIFILPYWIRDICIMLLFRIFRPKNLC